jgi:hypothetical protein
MQKSIESEQIAVNDEIPLVLWTQYFLEAQGCEVRDSVIHQDKKIALLLEENGCGSSGR